MLLVVVCVGLFFGIIFKKKVVNNTAATTTAHPALLRGREYGYAEAHEIETGGWGVMGGY
jgi:hypothetical protein